MGPLSVMSSTMLFVLATQVSNQPSYLNPELDRKLTQALQKTMPRFACNLSHRWNKKIRKVVNGVVSEVEITSTPGSIVAAPHSKDPDYIFHWIRDSALVTSTLSRVLPYMENNEETKNLKKILNDYVSFSRALQSIQSPASLGEARYHIDGSRDLTPGWNTPQNDGPALRALTLLRDLEIGKSFLTESEKNKRIDVIKTDLDYITKNYLQASFDPWEYVKGQHFYVRLVQMGALEKALQVLRMEEPSKEISKETKATWKKTAQSLRKLLSAHWNLEKDFYSFSVGPVFTSDLKEVPQPGLGLDASIVLAVNHAHRLGKKFTSRDDKLQSTVLKMEKHFRQSYAINHETSVGKIGPACGRHPGDGYYGGHAWFVVTSAFAEHYFNLAEFYSRENKKDLKITRLNQEAFSEILGRPLAIGENIMVPKYKKETLRKIIIKGEAFLETMLKAIPADGRMAEQFDQNNRSPIGATNLSWSYSSFLSALLARENIMRSTIKFSEVSFSCHNTDSQ